MFAGKKHNNLDNSWFRWQQKELSEVLMLERSTNSSSYDKFRCLHPFACKTKRLARRPWIYQGKNNIALLNSSWVT